MFGKTGNALAAFFGLGGRRMLRPKTGNRALPKEMQQEVIAAAEAKRARKQDTRQAVYHQQKKLNLF